MAMAVIYGVSGSERELLNKYPSAVKKIDDIGRVYEDLKRQLKKEDSGFFGRVRKWNKRRQINKFEENEADPGHAGASGELRVLNELSKLPDDYHVLCGVERELPRYVTYKGQKNLRSAQMDFVVVSKRGVVVIEVKNWSSRYYARHGGITPHEQVDRAGMVLWILLKSWKNPQNPRVTKILLPIQENMRYDPGFKYVLVRHLGNVNSFILSQREVFSEREVSRVVGRLKNHVTN